MLKTIRVPKNLHYLTDRLPKPNYEDFDTKLSRSPSLESQNKSLSPHLPRKMSKGQQSLPKLHPSKKGNSTIDHSSSSNHHIEAAKDKKKKKGKEDFIIEGRSKVIEEARNY